MKRQNSGNLTINDESLDGMLGTQTYGGRIEGGELWQHPLLYVLFTYYFNVPTPFLVACITVINTHGRSQVSNSLSTVPNGGMPPLPSS